MHTFERDSLHNRTRLNSNQGKEYSDHRLSLMKDEEELTHEMEAKIKYLCTPEEPIGEGAIKGCMCACNGCE